MKPFKKQVMAGEAGPAFIVELVGGPMCGDKVTWHAGEKFAELKYYGGFALYELEEHGETAIHRRG